MLHKLFQKAFDYAIIKYWFASQSPTFGCMVRAVFNRRVSTQGWRVVNPIKLWSWIFNICCRCSYFLGQFLTLVFVRLFTDSYFYSKNWSKNEKWIDIKKTHIFLLKTWRGNENVWLFILQLEFKKTKFDWKRLKKVVKKI